MRPRKSLNTQPTKDKARSGPSPISTSCSNWNSVLGGIPRLRRKWKPSFQEEQRNKYVTKERIGLIKRYYPHNTSCICTLEKSMDLEMSLDVDGHGPAHRHQIQGSSDDEPSNENGDATDAWLKSIKRDNNATSFCL
jgi:hypothetical protein